MSIDVNLIKELRDETGAGVMDIKKVLDETNGNVQQAREILIAKGVTKAEKKSAERTANDGLVYSYIHNTGKIGSMIVIACETDFVARTEDFKNLCKNIALQVCTGDYSSNEEVLSDDFIKDSSKKVSDLITEAIAKLGEKIEFKKFVKFSVND